MIELFIAKHGWQLINKEENMKKLLALLLLSTSANAHMITTEMPESYGVQTFISDIKSHHDVVLQNNKDYLQVFIVYTEICEGEHHCNHKYHNYTVFPHALQSFRLKMKYERVYINPGDYPISATTRIIGDEGFEEKVYNTIHIKSRW